MKMKWPLFRYDKKKTKSEQTKNAYLQQTLPHLQLLLEQRPSKKPFFGSYSRQYNSAGMYIAEYPLTKL